MKLLFVLVGLAVVFAFQQTGQEESIKITPKPVPKKEVCTKFEKMYKFHQELYQKSKMELSQSRESLRILEKTLKKYQKEYNTYISGYQKYKKAKLLCYRHRLVKCLVSKHKLEKLSKTTCETPKKETGRGLFRKREEISKKGGIKIKTPLGWIVTSRKCRYKVEIVQKVWRYTWRRVISELKVCRKGRMVAIKKIDECYEKHYGKEEKKCVVEASTSVANLKKCFETLPKDLQKHIPTKYMTPVKKDTSAGAIFNCKELKHKVEKYVEMCKKFKEEKKTTTPAPTTTGRGLAK